MMAASLLCTESVEEARKIEYRAPVKIMPFLGDTVGETVHLVRMWAGRIERLSEEDRKQMLEGKPAPAMESSGPTEVGTAKAPDTENLQ